MAAVDTTAERTDVMTDFQFKAILSMVIDIVREMKDADKIIERLQSIRDGRPEENINKD